jgi:hypothetical protein
VGGMGKVTVTREEFSIKFLKHTENLLVNLPKKASPARMLERAFKIISENLLHIEAGMNDAKDKIIEKLENRSK